MVTKILVVDDEVGLQMLMRQRFRHRIQSGDYAFQFATSGQEALTILKIVPDLDVLLLDINMPDMSGLALLAYLPELVPTGRAVMVSAYGDMVNVRSAMNQGAFDFIIKPIDFKDLELTIEKTARHVREVRESLHAKALADLKARFFDNITHEFRTPLSLIIAPVDEMLKDTRHDGPTRRKLHTVQRNARQLLHLINQLLDLAKLEADSHPLVNFRGDVVAFLSQIVESVQDFAEQKGLVLTFSANVMERETLFDADKWQKILTNLLSNAFKFTAAGGQIDVRCVVDQAQLVLTVTDTGIGIAQEHLPHIFDRFYQVDTSLTRVYDGSGIGLSLAYELANRVGGKLSVASVPGAGTTFTANLPIGAGEHEAFLVPDQQLTDPAAFAIHSSGTLVVLTEAADSALPLVLLVEDNSELLSFMAESLTVDYRILTAGNGRDGLEVAKHELPDIVISDVMMPEMDGYQMTSHLKNDPATDHIAVILLTVRTTAKNRHLGLEKGADDYLTKPFNLDELRLRLRNTISRQQKLRDYYQRQFTSVTTKPATGDSVRTTAQDIFMDKLNRIIEAHLDDSTFRAELLAEEVAMSVRTLTRKLSTLAGVTPARYIRNHRLRRAAELLRAGYPVSETAFMVGFEHPANFSTAFKEVYRQTPTEFLAG